MAGRAATSGVTDRPEGLVLDEMFAPRIAELLRARGHDVLALVADPGLRALTDPDVYRWAGGQARRVVTENVRDFRSLVASDPFPGVLLTSSRTFSRSRASTGVLVDALDAWLTAAARSPRPAEDWLQAPQPRLDRMA